MPGSDPYFAQEIEHSAVPAVRRLHLSAMTYTGERDQHRTANLGVERLADRVGARTSASPRRSRTGTATFGSTGRRSTWATIANIFLVVAGRAS